MGNNGKSNALPVTTGNRSRLFWKEEGQEKPEYVLVVNRNSINDLMVTPDVPTVSKTDSTNGGKKSMQVLRWIAQQVWSCTLLFIGALLLTVIVLVTVGGVAFGWELGQFLAGLVFGG